MNMAEKFSYFLIWVMIAPICDASPSDRPTERVDQISSSKINAHKDTNMKHGLTDRFEGMGLGDLPKIATLTTAESAYVISLLGSIIDVLDSNRDLQELDPIFGQGKYFWPKDPGAPQRASITFGTQNFAFRSISIGFRREKSAGDWTTATMSIHPRNFPAGVFDMNLSKDSFSRFTLVKAITENRPARAIKEYNVFFYKFSNGQKRFSLQIEARPDVSSIDQGYPAGFHEIRIERETD